MKRALLLAGILCLAGCATPAQKATACADARQAVEWAKLGLTLACTRQSAACDTAGLVLKSANRTMAIMCPE